MSVRNECCTTILLVKTEQYVDGIDRWTCQKYQLQAPENIKNKQIKLGTKATCHWQLLQTESVPKQNSFSFKTR